MYCYCYILLQSVQVKIELGHRATVRKKPSAEGYTHDWTVFVRGPEGSNIQNFVEKVVFHLHDTFPKPKRCKSGRICLCLETSFSLRKWTSDMSDVSCKCLTLDSQKAHLF